MVTHQLQVERRTAKAHRPKTDALQLDYATNVELHGLQRLSFCVRQQHRSPTNTLSLAEVCNDNDDKDDDDDDDDVQK